MEKLTPRQLEVAASLKKLDFNELLALLPVLNEINQNLKSLADKETPQDERPEVQKVVLEGAEIVTIKGQKGDKGEIGEQGESIIGPQGERGDKGEKGDKGDRGDRGESIVGPAGRDGINGTNGIDGKNGSPDTGEQIIEKINETEGLIKRERVEGLSEELRRIESLPRAGGGMSAMGVRQAFKYIFHTEAPVGAIDGVNTTYFVQNTIFAVVAFSLNGEVIAQLPNYTISNKSIIFSSALPAVYSGKDFEIKYIG